MEILIATNNKGKAKEISKIFEGSGFDLKFLFEMEEDIKNINIQENAKTFEGNSLIKAMIVGQKAKMVTLADDSGLCVEALNGAPGVKSARYSEEGTDESNNKKLLEEMIGIPMEKRDCHYICNVAIYNPGNNWVETVFGKWHGKIAEGPRGTKSFGYAPIFMARDFNYQKTNAEFEIEELARMKTHHRAQAFTQAIKILQEKFK